MDITVNVVGQVSQIRLGQHKALWPLFETVINSIQSLEDTNIENKKITIEALRNPNIQLRANDNGTQYEEPSHFEGFVVTDNGNGFNTDNYKSFLEAYSQLKVKKGCKGIGRFLWLKAFDKVEISSTFYENNSWYNRAFEFTLNGIAPAENIKALEGNDHSLITKVELIGFKTQYRDFVSYKLESLAKKVIEHCLPYFIMGDCPTIDLKDNRGELINLNKYYDITYKDSLKRDTMELGGRKYQLYHMLLSQGVDGHELHMCANNREVKPIELSKKIPNLEKGRKISTEEGNVFYVGYLSGDYLDEAVNFERSEFEFDDNYGFSTDETVGEEEIVDTAVDLIKLFLHDNLEKIGVQKKQQIDRLVQSTHPQYRLLLNKRPNVYEEIPSGLSDDKIGIELYKHQQKWEMETVKQRHEIEEKVRKNATTDPGFQDLFDEYCRSITELSRAGLAEYVIKRKAIIDLLAKALEVSQNGDYSLESRIHQIICPMQASSDEIKFDDMNLWLIDDRLVYHHYLASDKLINTLPTLENDSQKRMDLAIFDAALSYTSDSEDINSITIVELKRPQRTGGLTEDNDPVWQVLKYVRDIKEGKVKKSNGRDFGDMSRVSFYCYIIADLTQLMKDAAYRGGLRPTQDNQGYFGYNDTIGAYIEVISYDKLLKNAKQRNKVFFDKLFGAKTSDLVHPELI